MSDAQVLPRDMQVELYFPFCETLLVYSSVLYSPLFRNGESFDKKYIVLNFIYRVSDEMYSFLHHSGFAEVGIREITAIAYYALFMRNYLS